jgi:hypothetical protein
MPGSCHHPGGAVRRRTVAKRKGFASQTRGTALAARAANENQRRMPSFSISDL